MMFIKDILLKPRGVYFSIVTVLTLNILLLNIAFSIGAIQVSPVEEIGEEPIRHNLLSIENEDSNVVTLEANSSSEYVLNLESQSNIATIYSLYYDNENVDFELLTEANDNLDIAEVKSIKVRLTNTSDEETSVEFKLDTVDPNEEVNIKGTLIR